jgi:hypothetical protein
MTEHPTAAEVIAQLVEALEAEDHVQSAGEEYYRQADLGYAPSPGCPKLTFNDLAMAREHAEVTRRTSLAAARAWQQREEAR